LAKQAKIFFLINTFLCLIQMALTIFGMASISAVDDLVCSGGTWEVVSFKGDIFSTVHILIIIFQGVMIEQMFYKIPMSHGHFFSASSEDYPPLLEDQETQCSSI